MGLDHHPGVRAPVREQATEPSSLATSVNSFRSASAVPNPSPDSTARRQARWSTSTRRRATTDPDDDDHREDGQRHEPRHRRRSSGSPSFGAASAQEATHADDGDDGAPPLARAEPSMGVTRRHQQREQHVGGSDRLDEHEPARSAMADAWQAKPALASAEPDEPLLAPQQPEEQPRVDHRLVAGILCGDDLLPGGTRADEHRGDHRQDDRGHACEPHGRTITGTTVHLVWRPADRRW